MPNPFSTDSPIIVMEPGPWEGWRGLITECRAELAIVALGLFDRQIEIEVAYAELLPVPEEPGGGVLASR